MKLFSIISLSMSLLILSGSCKRQHADPYAEDPGEDSYCVAGYYQPYYHPDPRMVRNYGFGWTGWELVKSARPQLEDNHQPGVPMWGYTDDSNPRHMEQKIDAAANNGLDVFIFDWYFNNEGPFLQGALEQGFFKARNNERMKFGLRWANQDLIELIGRKPESASQSEDRQIFYRGEIDPETWQVMSDYIIDTYFRHSSYWTIDNAPYFSVLNLSNFLGCFGSMDRAKEALEAFRAEAREAGFRDIHLNVVYPGKQILPSGKQYSDQKWMEIIEELGFSSVTSNSGSDPTNRESRNQNRFKSPTCLPCITMGWEGSSDATFKGMHRENTPEKFKGALRDMKDYLDVHPELNNTIIIDSWNAWREGNYLEPDTTYGMAYLDALELVFGDEEEGQ